MSRYGILAAAMLAALGPPAILTQALFHFDGVDASTTIPDETGRVWTVNGDAQLDTSQRWFGSASLLLDGNGDYLENDGVGLDVTGNFTVEAWLYRDASGRDTIVSKYNTDDAGAIFAVGATDKLTLVVCTGTYEYVEGATTVPVLTWCHVAAVKEGAELRVYLDGILDGTATLTGTPANDSTPVTIGRDPLDPVARDFAGRIDEFRWRAEAVYTADFTPPVIPFDFEGAGEWVTAYEWTSTSTSPGWSGYTHRQKFGASHVVSGTRVRITVSSAPAVALDVTEMYVGLRDPSGDHYDFAAAPIRATFNGGEDEVHISAATSLVSDPIDLEMVDGDELLVSSFIFGAGDVLLMQTGTDVKSFYGEPPANEAADEDVTGYIESVSYQQAMITKLEIWQPAMHALPRLLLDLGPWLMAPCDETSGTVCHNLAGTGDGTYESATLNQGSICAAGTPSVRLSASGSGITFPSTIGPASMPEMSLWQVVELQDLANYHHFLTRDSDGWTPRYWQWRGRSDGQLEFAQLNTFVGQIRAAGLAADTPFCVGISIDSTGAGAMYVNGVQVGADLVLGAADYGTHSFQFFSVGTRGGLAENNDKKVAYIAAYAHVLTAADHLALAEAGGFA